MAEAKPQAAAADNDPSMEEILQSIRRIIAEEEKTPEGEAKAEQQIASEVFELTHMVKDDGEVEEVGESAEPPVDVLASIESALSEEMDDGGEEPALPASSYMEQVDDEPVTIIPAAAPPPPPPPPAPSATIRDDEALLSDKAARNTSAAFKKLTDMPQPQPQPTGKPLSFRNGDSVEDLVMELMRPMLKEWLDANLPSLVQRIVEREVRRLSGE